MYPQKKRIWPRLGVYFLVVYLYCCKLLGGLDEYKSEEAVQNGPERTDDCRDLKRQQAAGATGEIQSLFICSLEDEAPLQTVYFPPLENNRFKDLVVNFF